MLLRSSITTTKKFFKTTLKNFKSFFSPGYQKLPKSTSPYNHISYCETSNHVMDINMEMNISNNNGNYTKLCNASSSKEKNNQVKKREVFDKKNNEKRLTLQGEKQKDSSFISKAMKERRFCMVEKKLRELEKLDISNVDYVMDIEEVLYYYSRLTSPTYLEIVDRFFMEMYSD